MLKKLKEGKSVQVEIDILPKLSEYYKIIFLKLTGVVKVRGSLGE